MKLSPYWKKSRKRLLAHLLRKGAPYGDARIFARFVTECRAQCAEVFGIEAAENAELVRCRAPDGSVSIQLAVDPTNVPDSHRQAAVSYCFDGPPRTRH